MAEHGQRECIFGNDRKNKRQYNFTTDFNARTITFTTTHADSEIVTSDSNLITITADMTIIVMVLIVITTDAYYYYYGYPCHPHYHY